MKWLDKIIVKQAEKIVTRSRAVVEEKSRREHLKEITLNSISLAGIEKLNIVNGGNHPNRLDTNPDLSFKMFRAENGYVMQVHQTDRKTERQSVNLHVIGEDQDLGQAISHIITLESLKVS